MRQPEIAEEEEEERRWYEVTCISEVGGRKRLGWAGAVVKSRCFFFVGFLETDHFEK